MHPLLTLWTAFFDVCRFHLKPQDLPYSKVLLGFTLFFYFVINVVLSLLRFPIFYALLSTIVDIALLIILTSSLLYFAHHSARIIQTLLALAGAGCVFGIISIPLVYWLEFYRDVELGLPILLILGLGAWNLAVYAHVLRHALAIPFVVAVTLGFVMFLLNFSILIQIAPLAK
jgi:glucan phosphoethanolaminetransferase (alkaline phosphatase superfamily)